MSSLTDFTLSIQSIFEDSGVENAMKSIGKLGLSASASLISLNALYSSMSDKYSSLSFNAKMLGGDIENMNKIVAMGDASLMTNSQAVQNDLDGLMEKIRQIKLTGQIPVGFQMAGIDVNQGVDGILKQMQDVFKTQPQQMGVNLAEAMGVSNLYHVLSLSNEELEKMSNIPSLKAFQVDDILAMGGSLKLLKAEFIGLKDQALAKLAPAFNENLIEFLQYIKENQNGIITLISNTTKIMGDFAKAVMFVGNEGFKLIDFLSQSKIGMSVLFGAGLLFLSSFLSPTTIALGLVIAGLQDLIVWMEGGTSWIGKFLGEFSEKKLAIAVAGIGALGLAFQLLSARIGGSVAIVAGLSKGLKGLGVAGGVLGIAELSKKDETKKEGFVDGMLTVGQGVVSGAMAGSVLGAPGAIAGGIAGGLYGGYKAGIGQDRPAGQQNTTNNQQIEINITAPSGNAEDIASRVKSTLEEQMSFLGAY